jgi:hypothetical protein
MGPDIIIIIIKKKKKKERKTSILIDVAIPADRNIVQKQMEKKLKYNSLCTEIQCMWNHKCKIIPVIIGATGLVTKCFKEKFGNHTRKHSIDSLQKMTILGTSHVI